MDATNKETDKWKLDLLCKELSKLLDNKEACDRYERQSHVVNKLAVDYSYKDIRGYERYVR